MQLRCRLYNLPESFHDDVFVAKNMKHDFSGPCKILAGEQKLVYSKHLISYEIKITCNQYNYASPVIVLYVSLTTEIWKIRLIWIQLNISNLKN